MRILIAAESPAIAKSWCAMLAAQHYAIDMATDGQSAGRFIDTYEYDLLIINEILPQLDGISLCRQVRNSGKQMPIVLIAQHNDSHQRSIGLDAGADDYMVQPLHGEELVAKMRALWRRGPTINSSTLSWGNLQLAAISRTVTFEQKILSLTPKEYALLELLLHDSFTSKAGEMHRVFSYGVIIEHLWVGDDHPSEETVRTHMKGLRHKLKAAGMATDPIETVYGVGYRLRPSPILPKILSSLVEPSSSLLIADPDTKTAAKLAVLAQQAGLSVQTVTDIQMLFSKIASIEIDRPICPPILVLELSIAQDLATARQILTAVSAMSLPLSVIIWSNCTDLATRQMVASSNALWFMAKSNSAKFVFQTVQKIVRQQKIVAEGKKILVLHDDTSTLMSLHQTLEPLNFHLTSIKQPQLLWSNLTISNPDLVIIDLLASDASSLEVCQMIRQDTNWCHLPIVVLTQKFDIDTIQEFFVAGANDVWMKPIGSPEIIISSVRKIFLSTLSNI
jgi:DNA-binding response OmpR family regulator